MVRVVMKKGHAAPTRKNVARGSALAPAQGCKQLNGRSEWVARGSDHCIWTELQTYARMSDLGEENVCR
mgnify:CR=1 FL=1